MKRVSRYLFKGLLVSLLIPSYLYAATLPADGETPASLACIYGLTPYVSGCPLNLKTVPNAGSGVIAVIEGADDPNVLNELTQFSNQFNLTPLPLCGSTTPCVQVYYAKTCKPFNDPGAGSPPNPSKDMEPEIDFEWAHAMAPNASIYVVEGESWAINDIMTAVDCANSLLAPTGGIISLSVSYPEFAGEATYDTHFQTPGIVYLASSGDYSAPARYPSSSPYVISVGGTNIIRDHAGKYLEQKAWHNTAIPCNEAPCKTGGSGGPSIYEPRPAYQNTVQRIVGSQRGTPDIAFAAQGIDIFCCLLGTAGGPPGTSNQCPAPNNSCNVGGVDGAWVKTGGTSLATPAMAGIINVAHSGATTTAEELTTIYHGASKNYHQHWTDIILGNNGFPAFQGYDFTTGLGVPRGYGGK